MSPSSKHPSKIPEYTAIPVRSTLVATKTPRHVYSIVRFETWRALGLVGPVASPSLARCAGNGTRAGHLSIRPCGFRKFDRGSPWRLIELDPLRLITARTEFDALRRYIRASRGAGRPPRVQRKGEREICSRLIWRSGSREVNS